jgi:hypothetical protein
MNNCQYQMYNKRKRWMSSRRRKDRFHMHGQSCSHRTTLYHMLARAMLSPIIAYSQGNKHYNKT